jgi:hypothetical protein
MFKTLNERYINCVIMELQVSVLKNRLMGHLFLNNSHFVDYPSKYIIIVGS